MEVSGVQQAVYLWVMKQGMDLHKAQAAGAISTAQQAPAMNMNPPGIGTKLDVRV